MNYGELKEDEYYVGEWDGRRVIFIHSKYKETPGINSDDVFKFTEKWCSGGNINFRTPTLEEKHWLDACIKADKFIPLEEEAITEFKKDDYIVILKNSTNSFKINYCFKQRESYKYIKPEFDNHNSKTNGLPFLSIFNKDNWRYATPEEIAEYERIGKPYNVTTLNQKELSMEEIQEECKRRFPIGCTFKNPCNNQNYTIEENDRNTYKIIENQYIDGGESKGYLYYKDKYAELIETPEVIVPEYVECLENDNEYTIKNKIYKIDSWKKNNVWGICNIDCNVYKAGKSLCFDNWFENNQKWKHSTKEAYDNQLSKQKPLTPEQCYNTEIEVGDEVELISCEKSYYINNYLGQKAIIIKLNSSNTGSENKNTHWVKIKDNGENEHWKIKDLKLVKKHSNTTIKEQVDISSPQVTSEITVPRVLKKTEKVNFDFQNCEVKNINVPISLKQNKKIKQIKIEKFELFI